MGEEADMSREAETNCSPIEPKVVASWVGHAGVAVAVLPAILIQRMHLYMTDDAVPEWTVSVDDIDGE